MSWLNCCPSSDSLSCFMRSSRCYNCLQDPQHCSHVYKSIATQMVQRFHQQNCTTLILVCACSILKMSMCQTCQY